MTSRETGFVSLKLDFRDSVVLVTGASRGIGKRIALDFLHCGARLIVTATHPDREPDVVDAFGRETRFIPVDFSNAESTRDFLGKIGELERIDVCVNNAGLSRHKPLEEITMADWDVTHDVDLRAPFLIIQTVARIMRRHRYGRIVNVSSIWGHITMPGRVSYTGAKFGIRGLTVGTAVDLAKEGILVNAVAPGFTLTDMVKNNFSQETLQSLEASIPLGRLAEPSEISRLVLFLASPLNTYVTGQSLVIDGGYSII